MKTKSKKVNLAKSIASAIADTGLLVTSQAKDLKSMATLREFVNGEGREDTDPLIRWVINEIVVGGEVKTGTINLGEAERCLRRGIDDLEDIAHALWKLQHDQGVINVKTKG